MDNKDDISGSQDTWTFVLEDLYLCDSFLIRLGAGVSSCIIGEHCIKYFRSEMLSYFNQLCFIQLFKSSTSKQ